MADTKYIPRLKSEYDEKIVKTLMKELGIKNVNQVPKLEKVVINMGVGEAVQNAKILDGAVEELTKIAGHLFFEKRRASDKEHCGNTLERKARKDNFVFPRRAEVRVRGANGGA